VAKEMADWLEHVEKLGRDCGVKPGEAHKEPTYLKHLRRWIVLLAPPQRKPRRLAGAAKLETRKLDALCREIVFLRDNGNCRRCGNPARDWSHVYTRAKHGVRWDLDNSFAACRSCHHWWHENPLDGTAWWKKEIGPKAFAALTLRGNRRTKPNKAAVMLYLIQEKARLS
jgi:5-methylcytosine-specific restriction endonuclease McrA